MRAVFFSKIKPVIVQRGRVVNGSVGVMTVDKSVVAFLVMSDRRTDGKGDGATRGNAGRWREVMSQNGVAPK